MNDHCEEIANVEEITREEWLTFRRKGIGGSDAGAIVGLNPWKSPLGVYMEKVGLEETEENTFMRWGKRLEPVIRDNFAADYEDEEGETISVEKFPFMLRSKICPIMLANVDGRVGTEKIGAGGLEIKTATILKAKEWEKDQVPDVYYTQVQHYMAVDGLPFYMVVALLGKELVWRVVPRNDDFIASLTERELMFWQDNVEKKIPPLPTGGTDEDAYLLELYHSQDESQTVDLSSFGEEIEEYLRVKEVKETAADRMSVISQNLKAEMKEAKFGVAGDHKVTWSRFETTRLDIKKLRLEKPDVFNRYAAQKQSGRMTVK